MKTTITTALLLMLMLPAHAHTEAELESWLTEYERMKAYVEVTPEPTLAFPVVADLAALLQDMKDRHPCSKVLETPCPVVTVREHRDPSSAPSSGSGHTGMGNNVEQWRPLVEAYFGENTDRALRIMACESGGNPNAKNPRSTASGLFQFLASTWERTTGESYPGSVFDGESNIRAAAKLSDGGSNWGQWSCKP